MIDDLFAELVARLKETGAILRNDKEVARRFHLDIKRIREGYKLTQTQFAAMLGINARNLYNREQGRRLPEGSAMVLLRVTDKHPEAVLDAVRIKG